MINVTISPESRQVDESDTTSLFNILRNDDVILDRDVSVRVSAKAVTAGGKQIVTIIKRKLIVLLKFVYRWSFVRVYLKS